MIFMSNLIELKTKMKAKLQFERLTANSNSVLTAGRLDKRSDPPYVGLQI